MARWHKGEQRWIGEAVVDGRPTTARFYLQEAAEKWERDPKAHPRLPIPTHAKARTAPGRISYEKLSSNAPVS